MIEKRFAEENDYELGDTIQLSGEEYEIVGIGSVADYDLPVKNFSDVAAENSRFGLMFVTDSQYHSLVNGETERIETYTYAYEILGENNSDDLKKLLEDFKIDYQDVDDKYYQETIKEALKSNNDVIELDLNNLVSFVEADDNPRIYAAAADVVLDKNIGLIAGVIVMILVTFVISVFIVHQIQLESSIIGTLYAMGVTKKQLMRHYIVLPVIVSFVGGVIGCIIGFSSIGARYQMQDTYDYFSIPNVATVHPLYLIAYSILVPPVVAVIVNYLVINKKLSQTALSLMRNEQKNGTVSKIQIRCKKFISTFQIRQLLREVRTCFTVVVGMIISLLVFMIGLNCYVLCGHIQEEMKKDTTYEYMYTLKYPENREYENTEIAFSKTLSKDFLGYTLNIMVLGIEDDNKYFNCDVVEGTNSIVISKCVQQKYGLSVGDFFTMSDDAQNTDYVFEVKGIANYSASLTVFMDIDSMRELMEVDEDYYNTIFSDDKLAIDEGRIYSITTKEDINRAADVFVELFKPLVIMLVSAAIVIFSVVMYLMCNVMLERAGFGISLVKIFGYRDKEIRKVYLTGNFYVIFMGAVIGILISKNIADLLYPSLLANASCGMNLHFDRSVYVLIFAGIIGIYLIINLFLVHKLNNVSYADVLKERD